MRCGNRIDCFDVKPERVLVLRALLVCPLYTYIHIFPDTLTRKFMNDKP